MLRISMTTSKGFDIGGGIVCTLRIRKVRQSRSSDPGKTSRWNDQDTIGGQGVSRGPLLEVQNILEVTNY